MSGRWICKLMLVTCILVLFWKPAISGFFIFDNGYNVYWLLIKIQAFLSFRLYVVAPLCSSLVIPRQRSPVPRVRFLKVSRSWSWFKS